MIQPNIDMTGTGSARVGIVMFTVTFVAKKSIKQYYLPDNKYRNCSKIPYVYAHCLVRRKRYRPIGNNKFTRNGN